MLVPVMSVPSNVTEALAAVSAVSVGPCQYRRALVTVPETPLRVISPVPIVRMPPKPAEAKSVAKTVWKGAMSLAAVERGLRATAATPPTARIIAATAMPSLRMGLLP